MNTENKKLFEVGKAAAISGAVVDGIAAAISSFKVGAGIGGPVLGAAYAATSVVATGVQIAQLAGTSYGSGATQAAAPSVNEPTVSGSAAGQQGSGAATGQTLTLEGLNQGDLVSYDQLGSLVTRLNEFAEDGGTPLVVLA